MFFTIGCGNLIYSAYQGFIELNLQGFLFYQGLTLLVGLFPVAVSTLMIYNRRLSVIVQDAENLNLSVSKSKSYQDQSIEIPSQNKSEELKFQLNELLAVKAIENYVEVYLKKDSTISKVVLRNTLKNVIESFSTVSSIQKCHRSYLVNLRNVENFSGNAQGLTLDFGKNIDLTVPVSRSFVKTIRPNLSEL